MNGRDIKESDWKHLSRLKPLLLDRYCSRVLAELTAIATGGSAGSHERYLKVSSILHERDDELANAFNDLRRSSALRRLCEMYRLGLFTDDEFAGFSDELRESVSRICLK